MQATPTPCSTHPQSPTLIGLNKHCPLNCLICCQCLKSAHHGHKHQGVNHKTISTGQLTNRFNRLQLLSQQQITQCKQKLSAYLGKWRDRMLAEMEKERGRLERVVEGMVLGQVAVDLQEFTMMEKLMHGQYVELSCQQVEGLTKKLFAMEPLPVSSAYGKFMEYLEVRAAQMQAEINTILQSQSYQVVMLRDVADKIKYPHIVGKPQESNIKEQTKGQDGKRFLTEPVSPMTPKKTNHRSLRKDSTVKVQEQRKPTKSIIDLKDIKIKKPLQFKGSQIIKTKDDLTFIQKCFGKKIYDSKMLYRASDEDYSIRRFHQNCDGQKNTIVFVRTQFNKIIGGFTHLAWKSTNNTIHSDIKKQSFLFSLSLKQKFPLAEEKTAIFNSQNFGPTFGNGADLCICHNANIQKTSYAQFPYSYANSRYSQNNQHTTFMFTGQQCGNHFLIKQWEVWKLQMEE